MSYQLYLTEEVRNQIKKTIEWYEERNTELGNDFLLSVEETFKEIEESPLLFAIYVLRFRRRNIKRFPYAIIYEVKDTSVVVVGLLHHSRDIYSYLEHF